MNADLEEFKQKLLAHARTMSAYAGRDLGEAATNMVLVQPFLVFLGYNTANPDEVAPERHADFSEKYKNKVDYAIMRAGLPVIAIESKKLGGLLKDDLGQLKSYFNACPTVKLGILTDGLRFEFYADSDAPNMMDDAAFLKIDLQEVAKGNIEDNSVKALAAIRKADFNPENVGAEAKRKLLIQFIVDTLRTYKLTPSDDFVRLFLSEADVGARISKKTVESNRQIICDALQSFIDQEILMRVGYAPKDVVKKIADSVDLVETVVSATATSDDKDEELKPTEAELLVLNVLKERLAFLAHSDTVFDEIVHVGYKKGTSSIKVFYKKPTKGVLLFFHIGKLGKPVFKFPVSANLELETNNYRELNEPLLDAFKKRLEEAGVQLDRQPVLRSVS